MLDFRRSVRITTSMVLCAAIPGAPALAGRDGDSPGLERLIPASAVETSAADLDGDGLAQNLEHRLAAAFLPRIFYDAADESCSLPGALAWREPGRMVYFVVPKTTWQIDIVYVTLYNEDCGPPFTDHTGDAEPIMVELRRAPDCPLGWGLRAAGGEAHAHPTGFILGDGECHVQNGALGILVSADKHGTFVNRRYCDELLSGGFLDLDDCDYGGLVSDGLDEWVALNGGEITGPLHSGSLGSLWPEWATEGLWSNRMFCGGRECTVRDWPLPSSPPPIENKIERVFGGGLFPPNSAGDLIQEIPSFSTPHGTAIWHPVVSADRYVVSLFRREFDEVELKYFWRRLSQDVVIPPRWTVPANLGCADEACNEVVYGHYKIEARAANFLGASEARTIDAFAYFPSCSGAPPTPVAVEPAGPAPGEPTFLWNALGCGDSFDVEIYESGSAEPVATLEVTAPEVEVASLECDVEHWWRVRSHNAEGTSDWSAPLVFVPSCSEQPPSAPAGLTALAVVGGGHLVDLSWIDTSSNERGFLVRRLAGGSNQWQQIADLEPGVTTYRDEVPEPSGATTYYFYKVQAYNLGGEGVSDRAEVRLYEEEPGVPDTLRPRGCLDTLTPTLSWRGGGRSSQFLVRLTDAVTGVRAMPDVRTTAKSVAVSTPLEPGRVYQLRVWGENNVGRGEGSGPELFSPFCAPLAPPILTAPPPGCGGGVPAEIAWESVPGAVVGYQLHLWRVVDISNDVLAWSTSTTATRVTEFPADLFAPGQEYRVKVKAIGGVDGPYSPHRFFVADCAARDRPGTASPLAPSAAIDTTMPTYSWEPAALADAYTLEVLESSIGPVVLRGTWSADEICDASTCEVRPPRPLAARAYVWRARAHASTTPVADGIWGPWASFSVPALTPRLAVDDLVVDETATRADVVVRLTDPPPPPQTVRVRFETVDGSASAGGDYAALARSLEFATGQERLVVAVTLADDALHESDELFEARLSDAVGAALTDSSGAVVIVDDEPAPQLRAVNASAPEDQALPLAIRLELDVPAATPIVVPIGVDACTATAGDDFVGPKEDAVVFEPGETVKSVELSALDDREPEGDETVVLRFAAPAHVGVEQPWGEWRLRDDDAPGLPAPSPRADFDRDGRTDLLWRRDGGGALAVWTMDGSHRTGGFVVESAGRPDPGWEVVGVGDFDGDADADIAWRNRNSGRLSLWTIENGAVVAGSLRDGLPDLAWRVIASGDLDGDGGTDLAWWHEASGRLRAWLMNGWQVREERDFTPNAAAGPGWRPVALADLDGDGAPDLVWRNTTSDRLSVWYLDGTTRIGGSVLAAETTPGSDWLLIGGWDVDFDGVDELVFQQAATKRLLLWYVRDGARRCVAGFTPGAPADRSFSLVGPR
jgi:hypothetical protein